MKKRLGIGEQRLGQFSNWSSCVTFRAEDPIYTSPGRTGSPASVLQLAGAGSPGFRLGRRQSAEGAIYTLREGTTGRVVLSQVWAVAESDNRGQACEALRRDKVVDPEVGAHRAKSVAMVGDLAFYRKYTEGVLRRYLWLSMAGGRVASLLGRELFHGKITNYSVHNYEEVAIFCVDVEKCLGRLTPIERALLKRIAVQQYSFAETSMAFGICLRSCKYRYAAAVDKLTGIFLEARILEPLKSCQEGMEVSLYISK